MYININNPPSLEVEIDEFTLVLQPTDKVDCMEWLDKLEEMVEKFIELSKIEELFEKLEIATYGLNQGYKNGLTVPNRPWHLVISWNEDWVAMGICIRFSAYAYAVYKQEYENKYNQSINIVDFLHMVQSDIYTTRLSRIDLTADYKNYGKAVNPNVIYKKLKYNHYTIKNHQNREIIKTKSALDKNGSYDTFYIGSRKGTTNGFLRCYNKKLEQLSTKGFRYQEALQCESWVRFEAVFKGKYAHQITEELLNNVTTPLELQQFIAQKITEKYRFYDNKKICETNFTIDLINISNGAQFNALRCESPRNNSLRQSIEHMRKGSGLFPLLYKVYDIWGEDGEKELIEHLYNYYKKVYKPEAHKNKEIRMWLNKNWTELIKCSLNEFLY